MDLFVYRLNKTATALLVTIFVMLFKLSAAQATALPANIKLASDVWVNGTCADGKGLYWDIIRLVYEPLGIKVEYNIMDYARSAAVVKQGRMDAWIGSYLNEKAGIIYPKWHFDADLVTALYKKSADFQWQGAKSLAGKEVGWIKGYHYNKYIDVKFNIKEFQTRENAIESLAKGQLDFFLEARNELKNEFIEHHLDSTKFESRHLINLNLFLGFANNEKGYQLQQIFDTRFAELLKSGEIKRLYDKWNWPIYPFTILCSYADSAMINC